MSTIGNRIKLKRKELGLTQAELGEKLNITDRAVSKWEQGEGDPNLSIIPDIAKVLGVSLDYLLLGKEEEPAITLDDMDAEKRLSLLIKKDDVKNFKKYEYQKSAYVFGRSLDYGRNYNVQYKEPIAKTWLEIINAGAKKIFSVCCDELIKKNTLKVWTAFLVYDFIDEFVQMAVDVDRPDILETIGFRYFAVGNRPDNRRGEMPFQYNYDTYHYIQNVDTYFIKRETLEYFFINKDKSPQCFVYATSFELQIVPIQNYNGRKQYTFTHLHDDLVFLSIKYKAFDALDRILECYRTELKNENIITREYNGYNMTYNASWTNTYVVKDNMVSGRIFFFTKDAITNLLKNGDIEYGKKLNDYNGEALARLKELKYDIGSGVKELGKIAYLNESELERFIKLNSDIPELDKVYLRCINQKIVVANEVCQLRDLKVVRDILNKSYYNYYEYVFEMLSSGNLKDLLRFFLDNGLNEFAESLVLGKEQYPNLLKSVWETFALNPGYVGIRPYEDFEKLIKNQNPIETDPYGNIKNNGKSIGFDANKESKKLTDNKLIEYIKNLKENIYNSVSNSIDAENKIKQDAKDRAKVVKGLTKEYFEGLLGKNSLFTKKEQRLFILDLCSLFDAILKFDYKCEGEDLFERMTDYFNKLKAAAPQSRTMDDGWGYQVPDTTYDEEVVIPEQKKIDHLCDIFSRLRIQRNNIAHSESKNVQELNEEELRECLKFVFSINKEGK